MKIDNEQVFRHALTTGINLFLGAGFSVLAKDSQGCVLPTGNALVGELVDHFNLGHLRELDLAQLSTILESTRLYEFRAFLNERFTVEEFDSAYRNLLGVRIRNIFTVNIDDLVPRIYDESPEHLFNHLELSGPVATALEPVNFVALHGCISYKDRPLTFSSRDLASAFSMDRDKWCTLSGRLQSLPILFWGTSMADAGTLEALNPNTVQHRSHKDMWVLVLEGRSSDAQSEYFRSMGFHIISGDTAQLLEYLADQGLKKEAGIGVPLVRDTSLLFKDEAIPKVGSVPVRPLMHFYKGAKPEWYDIFTGRLHKTSHLSSIRDNLYSGKNVLILGLPACGKSTLLMQAAASIEFRGHKLFVSRSPTEQYARVIVNRLAGDQALIFVDDFTDVVDAFEYLAQQSNITLMGADREYNVEIISHRLKLTEYEILDVTKLTPADKQRIINLIPPDVKAEKPRPYGTSKGQQPSLFEVIEANLMLPTLKDRYRSVIDQLRQREPELLEFLILCSYVDMCRTPISMDMLIAYFDQSYEDVYSMQEALSTMVPDYTGPLADEEQDFFAVRSTYVSDAVTALAPQGVLKKVLLRFHNEVSPLRIHRYDIFRKRAYDKEITVRAFADWREGKRFYEAAYARDRSPYLLQQGALYLAKKKQFDDAFSWIDDAIVVSGGKIFSIRNSHAVILFDANKSRPPENPTVKATLHESMHILAECYSDDKRKVYHALRFADQALIFSRLYPSDSSSLDYLDTAKQWLEDEAIKKSWHSGIKRLLRNVKNQLSRVSA